MPGDNAVFVYLRVIWWSTWYPGRTGRWRRVAQRIFSAKNERHGLLATLWFNVARNNFRSPWPWILTALASLILYPIWWTKVRLHQDPDGSECLSALPARLHAGRVCCGIHVDDRHAAQLGRFIRHQRLLHRALSNVMRARNTTSSRCQVVTVLLMIVSLVVTFYMESIGGALKLLLVTGAGTGTVLLLRWYWWRINAWSEVSAMITAASSRFSCNLF